MKNGTFLWSGTALRAAGIAVLALVLMFTACPTDDDGGGGYYGPDKTALNTAIANAEAAKAGVEQSSNGAGLASGTKWATQADLNAFNSAINAAKVIKNNASASQDQVNDAVAALNNAINAFIAVRMPQINTIALTTKITEAEIARDSVTAAADAGEVTPADNWANPAQLALLNNAIADAKAARAAGADQTAIDNAVNTLSGALTSFNTAVTGNPQGTKTTGFTQTDLDRLIARANAAKEGVLTSDYNGDDVPPSAVWIRLLTLTMLNIEIANANSRELLGVSIDSAYLSLAGSLRNFNNGKTPGSTPNIVSLQTAITNANNAKDGVAIAAEASLAPAGSRWVTQAEWDALNVRYTAAVTAKSDANATKNEVATATTNLNNAINIFNNRKAANGEGTATNGPGTAGNGLTIIGLGTIYNNGTKVGVGVVADMAVDFSSVNPVYVNVTGGSLTVPLATLPNGSYYVGFSVEGFIVFITSVTFSGSTVSKAYPDDFELLTWSVRLGDMGLTSPMKLDAAIQAMAAGMPGNPTTYAAWKPAMQQIVIDNFLGEGYANTTFLDVGLYNNAAKEFSGEDTIGPTTVIYTKFPLEGLVKATVPGEGENKPGESGK